MLTLVSNVKIKIIQYHDERFLELLLELAERRQPQLLHFFVQPIRADANSFPLTRFRSFSSFYFGSYYESNLSTVFHFRVCVAFTLSLLVTC